GTKIRRGLGTERESAQAVLADLQTILADEYWWSFERKTEAEEKFREKLAVSIFYEGMEPTPPDYAAIREKVIGLPDRRAAKPHAYVLPIGPAGAGQSPLDRRLLGTAAEKHRLPAPPTRQAPSAGTERIHPRGPPAPVA